LPCTLVVLFAYAIVGRVAFDDHAIVLAFFVRLLYEGYERG